MNQFFKINKSTRKWHVPLVAGLTVGLPLLIGLYTHHPDAGKLASLAGLSILYLQSDKLSERMILLMTCCFGMLASYTIGLLFSFNHLLAPVVLTFLSFGIHFALHKLKLTRPPGSFFFIMLASTALCTPFQAETIPAKIGYVAMGSIFTCGVGLIYSLLTLKEKRNEKTTINPITTHNKLFESITFALFVGLSLAVAFLFNIKNPYWTPISCMAVMQGSNVKHIGLRGVQRIVGTLIGLGLTWGIASLNPTPQLVVGIIILLQIVVEILIVRNYAIAVVFLTALAILMVEPGSQLINNTDTIFRARVLDTLIGSCIGMIGGMIIHRGKLT